MSKSSEWERDTADPASQIDRRVARWFARLHDGTGGNHVASCRIIGSNPARHDVTLRRCRRGRARHDRERSDPISSWSETGLGGGRDPKRHYGTLRSVADPYRLLRHGRVGYVRSHGPPTLASIARARLGDRGSEFASATPFELPALLGCPMTSASILHACADASSLYGWLSSPLDRARHCGSDERDSPAWSTSRRRAKPDRRQAIL